MKPWVIAVLAVGVLVLSGLPVLAVALASDDDADRARVSHGQGHDDRAGARGPKREKVGKGHQAGKAAKAGKAWKRELRGQGPGTAWRSLTAAQRAKKMAELSRIHADRMQKWADCVAAGRDDCVRPLPPGLAKKR